MQVPRNLAVEHLEVTTIVVVVKDIYLYYYYYCNSHSGVSHGILPARSSGLARRYLSRVNYCCRILLPQQRSDVTTTLVCPIRRDCGRTEDNCHGC